MNEKSRSRQDDKKVIRNKQTNKKNKQTNILMCEKLHTLNLPDLSMFLEYLVRA